MKVPVTWLKEYCDPGWESEHLAERLAMTGTEVERVSSIGASAPDGFVVGRVLAVERHPDADRLSVCEVDTGDGTRTIVCGAPNVAADQMVPVALPGAVMPDGTKLTKAKLRGIESDGMILSETELEMGDDSGGIVVLESADGHGVAEGVLAPGTPLQDLVPVHDHVLELEVTSNRPDCLAIYGVAREVHAISEAALAPPPWDADAEPSSDDEVTDYASVDVQAPDLCPRFTARVFVDVKLGPSPLWLKQRLIAAGQRPINNVVDITNYVMLLTGQPLHSFDLDKVPDGELVIRRASDGERMTTLDGVDREFDSETVLVCDREGPSGIAGIMGGEHSEVSDTTTRVLLEAATWNGVNILRSSRRLGLRSEASARFEKQLHPDQALWAQHVASRLLVENCGARLVPGTIDALAAEPEPQVVKLRVPRVAALIGLDIDADTCAERLERLGFGVKTKKDVIEATVPADRVADVQREADLIEEVARLADLDRTLPATLPRVPHVGALTREQRLRRRAEDALRDLGCDEIVGWSFMDPAVPGQLRLPEDDPRANAIELSNPISAEQSLMRTNLLGGLLDAARLNFSRGAESVALFESARVYLPDRESAPATIDAGEVGGEFAGHVPSPAYEPHRLALLLAGPHATGWRGGQQPNDYYAAKGMLESLCAALGVELSVESAEQPFLHPGRSAGVLIDGVLAGWIGELHPLVAREWDLESAAAFDVDLAALFSRSGVGIERYEDVITYPPVHQDVAVVVPDDVPAAAVRAAVLDGGGALLRSAVVFDLYRGEQVGEGSKSLALRLTFQDPGRTLTDEEVAELREPIRAAVEKVGGSFRE
jgi:phenylalanyl-tRNA synthetase beta chain